MANTAFVLTPIEFHPISGLGFRLINFDKPYVVERTITRLPNAGRVGQRTRVQ